MNNPNLLLALLAGYTFTSHGWYHGNNDEYECKVWDDIDYDEFRSFTDDLESIMNLTTELEKQHGFFIELSRSTQGYQLEQVIKKDGSKIEADISSKNLALFLSEVLLKVLVTEEVLEKARMVEEHYPHHYKALLIQDK